MAIIRGSCICGNITYEVTADFRAMYFCHCTKCQKFSGTGNTSLLATRKEKLHWLRGAEKLSSFTSPSGYYAVFCPNCGSPMPKSRWEKIYLIPAGSLDGEPQIASSTHLYCKSKAQWQEISDGHEQYAEGLPVDA